MPVDLSSVDFVSRRGLLVESDHLLILESRAVSSRLWRLPFDQVTRVVVTRKAPVVRILVVVILIMLPSLLLLLVRDPVATGIAVVVFAVGALMLSWYGYCGKTQFEIAYGPKQRSFTVMARPGRVRRFVDRLVQHIEAVQAQRRAALSSEADGG